MVFDYDSIVQLGARYSLNRLQIEVTSIKSKPVWKKPSNNSADSGGRMHKLVKWHEIWVGIIKKTSLAVNHKTKHDIMSKKCIYLTIEMETNLVMILKVNFGSDVLINSEPIFMVKWPYTHDTPIQSI